MTKIGNIVLTMMLNRLSLLMMMMGLVSCPNPFYVSSEALEDDPVRATAYEDFLEAEAVGSSVHYFDVHMI